VMAALAALLLSAATVRAETPIPRESRQMLLSTSTGWDETKAVLRRYERVSAKEAWRPVGSARGASLGRAGLAWGLGLHPPGLEGPVKKEGDGRSPAGVFLLREAVGYSETAPAGTRLPYRQATRSLRCVDDPRSRHYNRLVDEAAVRKDWASAEDMRREDDLYRLVVCVGHNDHPPRAGAGSCIFLHLRETEASVTVGCTAVDRGVMEELLLWLDPEAKPVLVQLPEGIRRRLAEAWVLPGS
jgi:D-alanyl-D-alanine dipeptidase